LTEAGIIIPMLAYQIIHKKRRVKNNQKQQSPCNALPDSQ